MKKIICLLVCFLSLPKISPAQLNWKFDYSSVNIAFLILDYKTYKLEGGCFTKHLYRPDFQSTGLPFNMVYHTPADSGDILFTYKFTNDTVFYASMWWMGCGRILYPKAFDGAELFANDSTDARAPYMIQYYRYFTEISEQLFHAKADSAYQSVQKLSILKQFNVPFTVFGAGFYLYAPAEGVFDPNKAKWIVFLLCAPLIIGVQNDSVKPNDYALFQNYPNPFNPLTNIEYSIAKAGNVKIVIYDILGKKMDIILNEHQNEGRHKVVFNGSNYSSGIYFYQIITNNYSQTKKLLLIK